MDAHMLDVTTIEPDWFFPFIHRQTELYKQNSALPGSQKRCVDIPVGLAIPHSAKGTPLLSRQTSEVFNLQPSTAGKLPMRAHLPDWDSDSNTTSPEPHVLSESQPPIPRTPSPPLDLPDLSPSLYRRCVIQINVPERFLSQPPQHHRHIHIQ